MLILASALGCGTGCSSSSAPVGTGTASGTSGSTAVSDTSPVTEGQGALFGHAVEQAVQGKDLETLSRLFELESAARAGSAETSGNKELDPLRETFIKEATNEAKTAGGIFDSMLAGVQQGGRYQLLRVDAGKQPVTAIFRQTGPMGSHLNYHRFVLARNSRGDVVAQDLYSFESGENFSDALRRDWLPMVREKYKTDFEKQFTKPDPLVSYQAELEEFFKQSREKKPKEALADFHKLPEPLRKTRFALMTRIALARDISEGELDKAVAEFAAVFPDDPALDLLQFDRDMSKKAYDKAIERINRLNTTIGGDPYLIAQRAYCLAGMGKSAEARSDIDQAMRLAPNVQEVFAQALDISILEKKYDESLRLLKLMNERFHPDWADFASVPEYSEFIKSKEYQEWQKFRVENAKGAQEK